MFNRPTSNTNNDISLNDIDSIPLVTTNAFDPYCISEPDVNKYFSNGTYDPTLLTLISFVNAPEECFSLETYVCCRVKLFCLSVVVLCNTFSNVFSITSFIDCISNKILNSSEVCHAMIILCCQCDQSRMIHNCYQSFVS